MSISRRQFIASLGGAGLFYAFRLSPGAAPQTGNFGTLWIDPENPDCVATVPDIDYRDWIAFGPDGKVSVFTGRTELGQGLKTVITAVVTQGLEITQEKLTVIQGDTDLCPDDGPTVGSCAAKIVGWGFWLACQKIRGNLVERAARFLRMPVSELQYRRGGVGRKGETGRLVSAPELGPGEVVTLNIDPEAAPMEKQYIDLGLPNVNGQMIVTGSLKYVGDLHLPGMLYAGWLGPPYHPVLTSLQTADLKAARALPGVKMAEVVDGRPAVVAERYSDVRKALDLIQSQWSTPTRPLELRLEEEVRDRAKLKEIKLEVGDVEAGLASSDLVLTETYTTQYTTHAQMETDSAVARMEGDRVTVWAGCQHAHKVKEFTASYLNKPLSDIHVIAVPVGGAFGGKIAPPVCREAGKLSRMVGAPIKLIYSRKDQFQLKGAYKAACVIDVTTGVNTDGKLVARKVDVYQDTAEGTNDTYAIPHARTRFYMAWVPFGNVASRGTSFVQTCFATESHMDMVAHRLGIDPFEFRRQNAGVPVYKDLIDNCADMIGYDNAQLGPDEGIGLAIIRHGGAQFGAVAARVAVDRNSGKIEVKHICGAFDIGIVINQKLASLNIRGAITWGIGYALSEEVMLNGHGTQTEYLSQYRIPRFSDIPPIDFVFHNTFRPTSVRGCGEIGVIPTIGAIANAVYNAIGVRFYSPPMTPDRVKQALGS